jgi:hypothetical protein
LVGELAAEVEGEVVGAEAAGDDLELVPFRVGDGGVAGEQEGDAGEAALRVVRGVRAGAGGSEFS